eukprot:gi/632986418/ref/XP_007910227.1/ PREDICTED: reticulocalbin-3 isoform X2 [Callorhinchus milii]
MKVAVLSVTCSCCRRYSCPAQGLVNFPAMKLLTSLCLLSLCAWLAVTGKPTSEKKDRVHHAKDLEERHPEETEGFQYDHEAFLGKETAETFDTLSTEESKKRLGKIVDRIDKNKDGFVTHEELVEWIKRTQNRFIDENVKKHWKEYDLNKDDKVSWEEYKNTTYGYYKENEEFNDVDDKASYVKMQSRDERRFKMADKDGDLIATREEFTAFLHPEEFDYMKDVIVTETMEDIDRNGDGFVDMDEFIYDMYNPEAEEPEPEWVKTERQQFREIRDTNKDGKLDRQEVTQWILPGEYDHAESESRHLIYESDMNKDGQLNKEEFLENYTKFASSSLTDFGELMVAHDEF